MANAIGNLIDNITEFIEVKTEQIKLKLVSKLAKLVSVAFSFSFLAILGLFFIFFLSFAISELLNDAFSSDYLGFLIVAGGYLLIIILIFILLRFKIIQNWLERLILKIAEKDEQDD